MKSLLLFAVFLPIFLSAQENFGPRLTAMGNNNAVVSDVWSIHGNAAAITALAKTTVAINYIRHFLSDQISTQGFVAVLPIGNNFLGVGIKRYGLDVYNQNTATFTYAKKFGNRFSMAMNVNYHQLKITNYGSTNGFSLDVGFYYTLDDKLNLGAFITNPSQQKFTNEDVSMPIETTFNIGASYLFSDKVLVATTVSKIVNNGLDIRLGLEYQITSFFDLRAGVTSNPIKQFAGFGTKIKKLSIDFATAFDTNLGYSPQLALGYGF